MTNVNPLFSPLTIKTKTLRNRIVMPPMVQVRPITSPEGIEWYAERARGGVALVIVEATGVPHFGDELTIATLKPLVDAVHDAGALIAIQLFPVKFGRVITPAKVSLEEMGEIFANYEIATEICAAAGFDGVEPHGAHNYLINRFFSPVQNRMAASKTGNVLR